MIDRLKHFWCKTFHPAGYPIHNRYICPDCHRVHQINWARPATGETFSVLASK